MSHDSQIAHYDRLADRFNHYWAQSPQFVAWMSANIVDRLNLRPGERALDLGCGTGLYAQALAHRTGTVVCADPSKKMLKRLPADQALIPIRATAQEIIGGAVSLPFEQYDVILAKEILHHVPRTKRPEVLHGLVEMLAPGGRILLVLMPPTIDHPLFDAALKRYEQRPIDPIEVAAILETTASLRVTVTCESFPLELSKDRWLTMVRNRYMSLLTKFEDTELEAGVSEIKTRYPGPKVRFNDSYIFIHGRRPLLTGARPTW